MKHKIMATILISALLFATVLAITISAATGETELLPDSSTKVSISVAGESVRFRFVPEFSCMYAFHSISEEDTYAELYDSEGNLLCENDDYFGLNFGIECVLEAGEEYVLATYFLDTLSTGSFELVTTTDHDVLSTITKSADCMDEGFWTHSCSICGHHWTEIIPAEHNYENGVCSLCGELLLLEGTCGDALSWHYNGGTNVLSITGSGKMYDYSEDAPPWYEVTEMVRQVEFSDGITYIGMNAFAGMQLLTAVDIPGSVTEISDHAFSYCSGLKKVVIPVGVKKLGAYSFAYCNRLLNVFIPETVNQIGNGAFFDCNSVAGFWVDEANSSYSSDDRGVLFTKDQQSLLQAPAAIIGSYSVPNAVRVIGELAFNGCSRLSDINISDNVTEIGSNAFSGCNSLTFVRVPAGVEVVGDGAFGECECLLGVLFEGNPPTSDGDLFEDSNTAAYYSSQNSTWTETVMSQLGASVSWCPLDELTILVQPRNKVELIGNKAIFSVGAYGAELRYTWWIAAPGSDDFLPTENTENTFELVVTKDNVGQRMYCVVDDAMGATVRSETVTIYAMPELVEDELMSVKIGTVTGSPYISYTPSRSCYYTLKSFGEYDAYCELYDAKYYLITTVDDGTDHNFNLRAFLDAGESYIFCVRIYDNADAMLQVQLQADHEYVNQVVPATCTAEGYTLYSCACGDTYVTNLTLPLEHKYVITRTEPTCTSSGSLNSVCSACGDTKATVLISTGHSYTAGSCSKCGEADPNFTRPSITLKAPTLEFKDMICIVTFYTVDNTDNVVEMGMLTYRNKVDTWNIETAECVIPGANYDAATGRYYSSSQGIHAKYLGDTFYLAIYAKLRDGTYVYSKLAPYSPITYATNQLKNSTNVKLKQLVVAMLNYGAAAQVHFDHNVEQLANSSLVDDQLALPEPYSSDMVANVSAVTASKQGIFANNQGFATRKPAVSFEGAFSINYFFVPNYVPDSGITLYYWETEEYNSANVLSTSNATGKILLEVNGAGEYRGDLTGIAAKSLSEAVYVAAVYRSGGTVWTSGVLGYSIGAYCSNQASKTGTIAELAKATAVYGYHAKQYFG